MKEKALWIMAIVDFAIGGALLLFSYGILAKRIGLLFIFFGAVELLIKIVLILSKVEKKYSNDTTIKTTQNIKNNTPVHDVHKGEFKYDMRKCKVCGQWMNESEEYCPKCGIFQK